MGLNLSSQVLLDNPYQLIMDVNKEMKIKKRINVVVINFIL